MQSFEIDYILTKKLLKAATDLDISSKNAIVHASECLQRLVQYIPETVSSVLYCRALYIEYFLS